jgi:hypothetical protein
MPQDALCVEGSVIASFHTFSDGVDPKDFSSFIGCDPKRLPKMMPDFLLRGPICSR